MATIQSKISRGNKYWYIVESRRVNGKPRPVVLAYLGKACDLLKRLQGVTGTMRLKSYSHGSVAALLKIANELNVPAIINKYIDSQRSYMTSKPTRNNLTAGFTFLLAAIGRACVPTSKRAWWSWARTTSCEYLLRCSLSKIDSQHFWDLMDALPIKAIEEIERNLLEEVFEKYDLESTTLFFDTTNFFTYINSTNTECSVAQRGKNKQKRSDLRQIGLALVVTPEDMIPVFHHTYEGNMSDSKVFSNVIKKIKERFEDLKFDITKHTIVFDRGNNSKKNLGVIKSQELHYVGALTPYHHKELVSDAINNFKALNINEKIIQKYRDKRIVWNEERTVVVFVSETLKAGQVRGIYQSLEKVETKLQELQKALSNPKGKKRNKEKLEAKIEKIINVQFIKELMSYSLTGLGGGKYELNFTTNHEKLHEIELTLGFRILMTNRHNWSTEEIIKAYYGQSMIENAFKNLKNPYHLALRPQYHWTDQKIKVHFFICVLGYLLSSIVYKQAKTGAEFKGTLDTLLDVLNNVRLATMLEDSETRGRVKAIYKLEEMTKEEKSIVESLGLKTYTMIE